MPLHELDLLFGALHDHVDSQLMAVTLVLHVDLDLVHQLDDTGLHRGSTGLDIVLRGHLVALGHELLGKGVDLLWLDNTCATPVRCGGL